MHLPALEFDPRSIGQQFGQGGDDIDAGLTQFVDAVAKETVVALGNVGERLRGAGHLLRGYAVAQYRVDFEIEQIAGDVAESIDRHGASLAPGRQQ